jgi:hypothetical protein
MPRFGRSWTALGVRLARLREGIAKSEEKQYARAKANFGKRRKEVTFRVRRQGPPVLYYPSTNGKLDPHWKGPLHCPHVFPEHQQHLLCRRRDQSRECGEFVELPRELVRLPSRRPCLRCGGSPAWEVDYLMDRKKSKGRTLYLVRWSGDFENIPTQLIREYERLRSGFRRR